MPNNRIKTYKLKNARKLIRNMLGRRDKPVYIVISDGFVITVLERRGIYDKEY